MKLWFLRIKHAQITGDLVAKARIAPIIFAQIPLKEIHLGMNEETIASLVNRIYSSLSPSAKGAHIGTLRRFLCEAEIGDLLGIQVNRESQLIFGRFGGGKLQAFPGLQNEGIKGRPFKVLTPLERKDIEGLSTASVKTYRGTFCNWLDQENDVVGESEIEVPDPQERQRRAFFLNAGQSQRQIKFIRVGADFGCGARLSRIFPGDYYHFIPIPKHNDPEFCRFTYGDNAARGDGSIATKGRSLMGLRKDDVLVFYAGFDPDGAPSQKRLVGIFAYLVVKEAYIFCRFKGKPRALRFDDQHRNFDPFKEFDRYAKASTWEHLEQKYGGWNAHVDQKDLCGQGASDLILCGNRTESKLLCKVEPLAFFSSKTSNYRITQSTAQKWGLTTGHDLKMSPVRTVDPGKSNEVYERLKQLV